MAFKKKFFNFLFDLNFTWYNFLGAILFWGFWSKSGLESAQNEVFWVLLKITLWNFSDLLHEATPERK